MKPFHPSRIKCLLLAALIAAIFLSGCEDSAGVKKEISKRLSIDCSGAEITESYDSHGGFLGDGTSFYQLKFSDASQTDIISHSTEWKPLPLTDTLQTVAWGLQDDEHDYAPMIIKDNDWDHPLIPHVANGYYFFLDRHSFATDPKDDSVLLDDSRPSYNFTLAIYDTDTNVLYYSGVDT